MDDGHDLRVVAHAPSTSSLNGHSTTNHVDGEEGEQPPHVLAALAAQRAAEALEGLAEYTEVWRKTQPTAPSEPWPLSPPPPLLPSPPHAQTAITAEELRELLSNAGKAIGLSTRLVVEEQMKEDRYSLESMIRNEFFTKDAFGKYLDESTKRFENRICDALRDMLDGDALKHDRARRSRKKSNEVPARPVAITSQSTPFTVVPPDVFNRDSFGIARPKLVLSREDDAESRNSSKTGPSSNALETASVTTPAANDSVKPTTSAKLDKYEQVTSAASALSRRTGGSRVVIGVESLALGRHIMKTYVQGEEARKEERVSVRKVRSNISLGHFDTYDELPEEEIPQGFCVDVRDKAKDVISDSRFDYGCALVILMNSIMVGIQTSYKADHKGQSLPAYFRWFDVLFCVVFSAELAIRFFVHRLNLYKISDWKWNIFDSVLVFLNVAEEILYIFFPADAAGSVNMDFSFMRVLRVLRLIRIIRLFRILRIIGELRTIISSIAGCLRPLMSAILLLILMVYVVAVFFTQVVTDYMEEDQSRMTTSTLEDYFGSLSMSIFSLYQAVLGGIDWGDLASPIVSDISTAYGLIFALFIAFSSLAIMNVVTGCFVESALASARRDEDVYMVNHLKELLKVTDTDGSGQVTWDEFKAQLRNPQMIEYFRCINIDVSEARNLFNILDVREQGVLSSSDFVAGCIKLRGHARALDLERLSFQTRQLALRSAKHLSESKLLLKGICEAVGVEVEDHAEEGGDIDAELKRIASIGRRHSICHSSDKSDSSSDSERLNLPNTPSRQNTPSERHSIS